MRQVGNVVSHLVYGEKLHKDAANVLTEVKWQCERDLARIGVTRERSIELIARAEKRLLETHHLCESPIEQMMLAAMAFMVVDGADCFPPAIHDVMSGEDWPVCPVVIVPQFTIARYRLDFLVAVETRGNPYFIAVECDGAKHHTNVADRERNMARDKYLRGLNIKTYRVPGGWIYKQNWKVADEIAAFCIQKRNAA